jgi:mRNA-degrading endonuclease RelE of RelBE toxin-antitoxin system
LTTNEYGLQISNELERRLGRWRVSVRTAIRSRLHEVARTAAEGRARSREIVRKEPPLCSYDFEGHRVSYQVDPNTRRVVVLDLARAAKA